MFQTDIDPNCLDQAMREQLSDSLKYIFDFVRNRLDVDVELSTQALHKIRTNKISPGIFARYYDLVFALNDENFLLAQRLIQEILSILSETIRFEIIPYSKKALGDDHERFPRLLFTSYSPTNPLVSPDQNLYNAHAEKLKQAIEIIRTVDNNIYREIDALLLQVIITVHNEQSKSVRPYAGGSSFMTWGAIFINAKLYRSLYQVVEFYVHELTHCVLFGYSCNEPLVLNPTSESYQSPLRTDPRPMDGIYHATLVCARLALFMKKWADISAIDDKHWLEQQQTIYLQRFFDGTSVIKKYARLSTRGSHIFKEAESCLLKYV